MERETKPTPDSTKEGDDDLANYKVKVGIAPDTDDNKTHISICSCQLSFKICVWNWSNP